MRSKHLLLWLLVSVNAGMLNAGEITLVRTFETWNAGIIKSTDPAGIVYHPPSGHLFISDSEIDEIDSIWNCENVFEINLIGDQVYNTFDSFVNNPIHSMCTGTSANDSRDREPSGITFNEFDGYYYITNDDRTRIMRYNGTFGEAIAAKFVQGADLEGITSDPSTGYLYAVVGIDGTNLDGISKVIVFNSDLDSLTEFLVNNRVGDPEGIALDQGTGHLFLVSQSDMKIFEYTISGEFVSDYDISGLIPTPIGPQGLTFAPSSDPSDDPANFNLYIVDGKLDNGPHPDERDGIVYEVAIQPTTARSESPSFPLGIKLSQNYPDPFNSETQIDFHLPRVSHVVIRIINIRGQEIQRLLNGKYSPGLHTVRWDGKDNLGNQMPSGIYFYQIIAGELLQVKKMILLK